MLDYKSEIVGPGPVAIKLGQMEVHAPIHEDGGAVTCPACPDKFTIGYHRAFPNLFTKEHVTNDLLSVLADDHSQGRTHQNSYKF